MVIIADEFFTGIPKLHTIRGSKPRLPDNCLAALQRVLDIGPEWLLGSHIIPIQGKDRVAQAVTKYRDVTQYLWDQSVRLINKGYTPVELQHALQDLPEGVWDPPYTVPCTAPPSPPSRSSSPGGSAGSPETPPTCSPRHTRRRRHGSPS